MSTRLRTYHGILLSPLGKKVLTRATTRRDHGDTTPSEKSVRQEVTGILRLSGEVQGVVRMDETTGWRLPGAREERGTESPLRAERPPIRGWVVVRAAQNPDAWAQCP